jgi:FlaA1/EpsC-like NDP-sugar epimerase
LIPIAFIDENQMRIGTRINGLPVLGGYEKLQDFIKEGKIESVLINLPRASIKDQPIVQCY